MWLLAKWTVEVLITVGPDITGDVTKEMGFKMEIEGKENWGISSKVRS